MYLARIADAQPQGVGPQGVTMPSQVNSLLDTLWKSSFFNFP